MNRLKISLYLAAIFIAGAATGAFVTFKIGKKMFGHPPRSEQIAAHWCGELESKLNLSPTQKTNVLFILTDAVDEFQKAVGSQMLISLTNSNARVARELTPEQRAKFVEIEKEQREFVDKFAERKASLDSSTNQNNSIQTSTPTPQIP